MANCMSRTLIPVGILVFEHSLICVIIFAMNKFFDPAPASN